MNSVPELNPAALLTGTWGKLSQFVFCIFRNADWVEDMERIAPKYSRRHK